MTNPNASTSDKRADVLRQRHLRLGWRMLAFFSLLGLVLETLNGFKIPWYVNAATETRRLMLTLAHAHGTLLGLINIAFGVSLPHMSEGMSRRAMTVASTGLSVGGVMLPLG